MNWKNESPDYCCYTGELQIQILPDLLKLMKHLKLFYKDLRKYSMVTYDLLIATIWEGIHTHKVGM